jgi:hypothetical protein
MRNTRITPHFDTSEFKFPPDINLILQLEAVRNTVKAPITIERDNFENGGYNIQYSYMNVKTSLKSTSSLSTPNEKYIPILGKDFVHDFSSITSLDGIEPNIKAAIIAIFQHGYIEGKNNDTPFGKYFKMNNRPWCAMVLHWCWIHAGIEKSPGFFEFASTYGNVKHLPVKKSIDTAVTGDGIFWNFSKNNFLAGHTGMVVYNDVAKQKMITIEGNSGDGMTLKVHSYAKLLRTAPGYELYGIYSKEKYTSQLPLNYLTNLKSLGIDEVYTTL